MDKMINFKSLSHMIDHLKTIDEVIGIVEYGGRSYDDMSIGGDYDFTLILESPLSSNYNGVHFYVRDIPIDCMILSEADFKDETPKNPFYLVHLDCKILHDKNHRTKELLEEIQRKWLPSPVITPFEKNLFRFTFQHIIDKLEHRLHKDPLFSRFFIHASFDWYLQCYARIHNLFPGQPKAHLNHIKENHAELYEIINNLYTDLDLEVQFDLLKKCANIIMDPLDGLWKKKELLLHLTPDGKVIQEEEAKLVDFLFKSS